MTLQLLSSLPEARPRLDLEKGHMTGMWSLSDVEHIVVGLCPVRLPLHYGYIVYSQHTSQPKKRYISSGQQQDEAPRTQSLAPVTMLAEQNRRVKN